MNEPLTDPATSTSEEPPPAAANGDGVEEEAPYNFRYEFWHFFRHGVPLGLSAVLEWGVPPMFSMIMAGHVPESADLQASLGFARVFWNSTNLMVIVGCNSYLASVIPGCIGAGRKDRIAPYFYRSMLFSTLAMLPSLILSCFAGEIMGSFGIPSRLIPGISTYCRLMAITSWLLLLECNVEMLFLNLGYTRAAATNSLVTGLGVDVVVTYLFIYRWRLGMLGAGLVQITVKSSRLVVWALLTAWFGLRTTLFHPPRKGLHGRRERILSATEARVFVSLAIPQILSCFTSWLVFELQILALAHIRAIPDKAVAAGAVWVQCESTLAAVQTGWIQVTSMRTLKLLGKRDAGAPRAFAILCVLSALLVGVTNVPLLLLDGAVARVVSNDPDVQHWFGQIVWLLALHQQTRISNINVLSLFIPLGKGKLKVAANIVAFYLIASPFAGVIALTDTVTSSIVAKMSAVVGATSVAQAVLLLFGGLYLARCDWAKLALVVQRRANTDRGPAAALETVCEDDGTLPTVAPTPPLVAPPAPLGGGLQERQALADEQAANERRLSHIQ